MLFSPKDCTTIWPDPSRCLEPLPPISNSSALVQIGSRPPVATLSGEETFGQSRVDTPARPWGPFIFRLVGALTFKFSVPGNPKATNRFQLAMDTDTGEAKHALVAKYERDFFGLTWEGNAGLSDDVVNAFSQGKIKQALAEAVSGKVKWSNDLWGDSVQFESELDVAADTKGCIFGVTGKLIGTLKRPKPPNAIYSLFLPPLPPKTEIVVEYAGSLRWNLTPSAWINLARRVGVTKFIRLLKACGEWGKVIFNMLRTSGVLTAPSLATATATATAAVGAVGGLLGFGIGMTMMAAQATYGRRLGILRSYCQGYVVRVFEERTKEKSCVGYVMKRKRTTDPGSGYFMAGYEDAGRAIRASSLRDVEGVLIRRFGTTFSYSLDRNASYFVQKKRHLTYGKTIDNEKSEAWKIAEVWAAEIVDNFDEYQSFVEQHAGDVSNKGW